MTALPQSHLDARESQLIVLLDDDVTITEGLALGLERDGRTIITCNDIESAQIIVERLKPSHVVADIHMSGPFSYEGLDFIRYAKRHTPDSRVILISGDAPEPLQLEAAERGAVAFLRKPFALGELDAMLDLMACSAVSSSAHGAKIIRMPILDEIVLSPSLDPYFQPIVRLDRGWQHFGYESLARFRTDSPLRNPDVLFKYAARKQRLTDLEFACTRRSFASGASLAQAGLLFVNVHPEVFGSEQKFCDVVTTAARRHSVSLDRVVLEITEQGRLEDGNRLVKTVDELRKLGVRFAFDDVGVAYSHLHLIDKVRPSFLKISQDFGVGLESDTTKMKIVANLLLLARDFKCELILEGIESEATAEAAADLGVILGQGFFFGLPADATAFRTLTAAGVP